MKTLLYACCCIFLLCACMFIVANAAYSLENSNYLKELLLNVNDAFVEKVECLYIKAGQSKTEDKG